MDGWMRRERGERGGREGRRERKREGEGGGRERVYDLSGVWGRKEGKGRCGWSQRNTTSYIHFLEMVHDTESVVWLNYFVLSGQR